MRVVDVQQGDGGAALPGRRARTGAGGERGGGGEGRGGTEQAGGAAAAGSGAPPAAAQGVGEIMVRRLRGVDGRETGGRK